MKPCGCTSMRACGVHEHAHELQFICALVAGNKSLPEAVRLQAKDVLLSIAEHDRKGRVIAAAGRFQRKEMGR